MWVCFGCGGIFACSDWHKIVILFLNVILKGMPHTAHRPLQEAAAAEDASRAAVQVLSYDAMRSRKAQCQAPPDNPETGDTYHSSRERRSCAGEKIEHQNVYKLHSSSSAGT